MAKKHGITGDLATGMGSFKSQFWAHLRNDPAAWDAMHKAPNSSHNRIVRLLELVSDSGIDGRLRQLAPLVVNQLVPSNKKLAGLADRLNTIGKELEKAAKRPGFILGSSKLLEFATECRSHARYLAILRPAHFARWLTYKSFWKCVPVAMLSRELVDPGFLSFSEAEELVRCADTARGRTRTRPKRSIERQYKGFLKHNGQDANPLLQAAWPVFLRQMLDVMLKMVPTR